MEAIKKRPVRNEYNRLPAPPVQQTAMSSCAVQASTMRHDGEGWRERIWLYWAPGSVLLISLFCSLDSSCK